MNQIENFHGENIVLRNQDCSQCISIDNSGGAFDDSPFSNGPPADIRAQASTIDSIKFISL